VKPVNASVHSHLTALTWRPNPSWVPLLRHGSMRMRISGFRPVEFRKVIANGLTVNNFFFIGATAPVGLGLPP
jgi:hypothetical protein